MTKWKGRGKYERTERGRTGEIAPMIPGRISVPVDNDDKMIGTATVYLFVSMATHR